MCWKLTTNDTKNSDASGMFQQIFQFGQGSDLSEFRETFDKAETPSKLIRTGFQFIEAVLPKKEKDIREFIEVCKHESD